MAYSMLNIMQKPGSVIKRIPYPGTTILKGTLVEVRSDQYIQPYTMGNTNKFAGVALEGTVPNITSYSDPNGITYGNPAVTNPRGIDVGRSGQLYRFPYSAAAGTNVGFAVYASDAQTIALTGTYQIGTVVDWETGYLWVDWGTYCI